MADGTPSNWDRPNRIRSSGIRLDELRYNSCRYIVSPDTALSIRYCGHDRKRGSYCGTHAELCYLPPKLRQAAVADFEVS